MQKEKLSEAVELLRRLTLHADEQEQQQIIELNEFVVRPWLWYMFLVHI